MQTLYIQTSCSRCPCLWFRLFPLHNFAQKCLFFLRLFLFKNLSSICVLVFINVQFALQSKTRFLRFLYKNNIRSLLISAPVDLPGKKHFVKIKRFLLFKESVAFLNTCVFTFHHRMRIAVATFLLLLIAEKVALAGSKLIFVFLILSFCCLSNVTDSFIKNNLFNCKYHCKQLLQSFRPKLQKYYDYNFV